MVVCRGLLANGLVRLRPPPIVKKTRPADGIVGLPLSDAIEPSPAPGAILERQHLATRSATGDHRPDSWNGRNKPFSPSLGLDIRVRCPSRGRLDSAAELKACHGLSEPNAAPLPNRGKKGERRLRLHPSVWHQARPFGDFQGLGTSPGFDISDEPK
jgi:hypothetical protein